MAKSPNQINKEAANSDVDSPAVLAYRVGQLERTVSDGFLTLHAKLDVLRDGFVTHEQMAEAIKIADAKHTELDRRITTESEKTLAALNTIDGRVTKLEGWQTWLLRLVMAAVILSVLALVLKKVTFAG